MTSPPLKHFRGVAYNRPCQRGILLANGQYIEDLLDQDGAYYEIEITIHRHVPEREGEQVVFGKEHGESPSV